MPRLNSTILYSVIYCQVVGKLPSYLVKEQLSTNIDSLHTLRWPAFHKYFSHFIFKHWGILPDQFINDLIILGVSIPSFFICQFCDNQPTQPYTDFLHLRICLLWFFASRKILPLEFLPRWNFFRNFCPLGILTNKKLLSSWKVGKIKTTN